MMRLVFLPLLFLVSCFGGSGGGGTPRPTPGGGVDGRSPFNPPPIYQMWWDEVADCTRSSFPFYQVSWFTVPGDQVGEEENRYGEANLLFNHITMAEEYALLEDGVKHEMGHIQSRSLGHPDPPFGTCVIRWVERP